MQTIDLNKMERPVVESTESLKQKKDYFSAIEQKIGYVFKNKDLLKTAFTHSSFAYRNNIDSNERLEFLGDSVLGFCVTTYLFDNFNFDEGESSKLRAYIVSSENVGKYIYNNKLEDFLLCDNFSPNNSNNVMGDLYEAIVGAMLIDSDIACCQKFIYKSLNLTKATVDTIAVKIHDYKTELQEYVQKNDGNVLEYVQLEKTGPAHKPQFTMQVAINGKKFGIASGGSKKEAENQCAKDTLNMLKNGTI